MGYYYYLSNEEIQELSREKSQSCRFLPSFLAFGNPTFSSGEPFLFIEDCHAWNIWTKIQTSLKDQNCL